MLIKNIVFLFPYSAIDEEKYGIPYLKAEGFNVIAFDMSLLLKNNAYVLYRTISAKRTEVTNTVTSYREFEEKIKEIASNSVFIDYLVGLSYFTLENEKIFRILKKQGASYYVISGGALPFRTVFGDRPLRKYMFFSTVEKIMNTNKLFEFVVRKAILFLTEYSNLYPIPDKIFSGNSEILQDYVKRHKQVCDRIIPVHSLDYDVYLEYVKKRDLTNVKEEKICVFLDEAATDHPDFDVLGMQPLNKQQYFSSMKRLFDKIEREASLEVIIAAHPFSTYEKTPEVFGNRKIIKGKTIDLVSKASLVVMHSTTAINYAVLFQRPILFVKTDDMIKKRRSLLVDVMADAVGTRAVNINNEETMNNLSLDYMSWPKDHYEEYMYKYIKSRDIGEKTVWEVVAEETKKALYVQGRRTGFID